VRVLTAEHGVQPAASQQPHRGRRSRPTPPLHTPKTGTGLPLLPLSRRRSAGLPDMDLGCLTLTGTSALHTPADNQQILQLELHTDSTNSDRLSVWPIKGRRQQLQPAGNAQGACVTRLSGRGPSAGQLVSGWGGQPRLPGCPHALSGIRCGSAADTPLPNELCYGPAMQWQLAHGVGGVSVPLHAAAQRCASSSRADSFGGDSMSQAAPATAPKPCQISAQHRVTRGLALSTGGQQGMPGRGSALHEPSLDLDLGGSSGGSGRPLHPQPEAPASQPRFSRAFSLPRNGPTKRPVPGGKLVAAGALTALAAPQQLLGTGWLGVPAVVVAAHDRHVS
jgi:hypothetical protein